MRRTKYQQIIDWNERQGGHRRLGAELVADIDRLTKEADAISEHSSKLIEFVPIRLVTTLEVFLRGVITELVDEGDEYFERSDKLVKGAKFDLSFAAHIDRRELTVGDFIAHAVSLNNVQSVISTLDTLLVDFSAKLKVAHPRWTEESNDWPLPPIIDDYDLLMASLARLYEVRHVLTHELPSSPFLDPIEVPKLSIAAKSFITATDWVVVEALHGSVPRTQAAMNLSKGDELRDKEAQLTAAIDEATTLRGIDRDALSELQTTWTEWADAQAKLVASQVEGGSMYPMLWASEKAALTRERIDQIERFVSEWMDK
ncbi:lysozyme inhibitor LprI family protein [uncultured Roseobacter sp.]|uniref:lysozyme inhibitor LprI family protein n=1 Tax=uncultured Roseobacter sp. TaxID=114847 RepID=UPI0026301C56|nr:lysozyme inhibitor LprI family protein [uncultured Roseobacter sp.]